MLPFTPTQMCHNWAELGAKKHSEGLVKALAKGTMGGLLLSCAGTVAMLVTGGLDTSPGVVKIVFALIFPSGITLCVLVGGDLVTSNLGIMLVAVMGRTIPWWAYITNVLVVTVGNFAGSLIIAGLFGKASGIFDKEPYYTSIIEYGISKSVTPTFIQILVRGIACNFLVVIAVLLAASVRDSVASKILAIWPPIFLFVAMGADHVVANMLFIPTAMLVGGSDAQGGVGFYLYHSFISAWIGNLLGAVLLIVPFFLIYAEKEQDLEQGVPDNDRTIVSSNDSVEKDFTEHID